MGTSRMMVEQLGTATTPGAERSGARASGLISGMTSGQPGSARWAEDLSITVAPALMAIGAKALAVSEPAAKKARFTPSNERSPSSSTTRGLPRYGILEP